MMRGLLGLTVIETRWAVEMVSVVESLTDPIAAVMIVVPFTRPEASPMLLTVAALGFEELHNAEAVTSWVLLSLNVPVAVNCFVVPGAVAALTGVTVKEIRAAAVTVRWALPLTDPEVAVTLVVPAPTAAATPVAISTVATPG